ncbi:MAG TPA: glutaminyl-peptide cyclotransferase, partial [Flavisolibacter sp.]|nr:glutaminyl-peptide cyclotransferase [Flavisolibacter sp.]
NINELEFIKGFIYANQWQYNYIVKIDPNKGEVVAKMDLSDVVNRVKARIPNLENAGGYLNGIAYNPDTDKIYITGKLWPELYEIQFDH